MVFTRGSITERWKGQWLYYVLLYSSDVGMCIEVFTESFCSEWCYLCTYAGIQQQEFLQTPYECDKWGVIYMYHKRMLVGEPGLTEGSF